MVGSVGRWFQLEVDMQGAWRGTGLNMQATKPFSADGVMRVELYYVENYLHQICVESIG